MAGYIGNKAVNLSTSGADISGTTNLDAVDIDGAVDMASTLAVAGVVTANAGVVVDNITIDGTEIDLSSGDLTIDVAGDIILDADGDDIKFNGSGNLRYEFKLDSTPQMNVTGGNFDIQNQTDDADIIFKGSDGGSAVTALTLDMSAAGNATFNGQIVSGDHVGVDTATKHDGSAFSSALTISGGSTSGSIFQGFRTANSLFELSMSSAGRSYLATTGGQSQLHLQTGTTVGSATTKMTIEANGDALINDGNLVIGTAGHGIDFSATADGSGTDSSSLLDDYEEGSWTPVLAGTTTAGTSSATAVGRYRKVGSLVYIHWQIQNTTTASMAGVLKITGLPYTPHMLSSSRDIATGTPAFYKIAWDSDGIPVTRLLAAQLQFMTMRNNLSWTDIDVDNGGGQYLEGHCFFSVNQ